MPRIHLPVIQSFKAPGSDREVQLRLHNHVYVFTSTASTQTDSEVFFVNGKPARAVHPFRVVPKKPKEIVSQMAELELALVVPPAVYTEPTLDMHYQAPWAMPPLNSQQVQEFVAQLPERPRQPEQQQLEQQQLEQQQLEQQQLEQQQLEQQQLEQQQLEQQQLEQQQLEQQQLEQQQLEQQQLEQQQLEQQQLEQQQFEQQQFEQQQFEQQQLFEQQQFEQQQFEQQHFEQQEVPVASGFTVQERQSQETQTDMELYYDEPTDTASASEDSNLE